MSDIREMYQVMVSFDNPTEGVVSVAARDADHAKELVAKQFENRKNLVIVDAFKVADVRQPENAKPEFDPEEAEAEARLAALREELVNAQRNDVNDDVARGINPRPDVIGGTDGAN
jgi:hypothetical protein